MHKMYGDDFIRILKNHIDPDRLYTLDNIYRIINKHN